MLYQEYQEPGDPLNAPERRRIIRYGLKCCHETSGFSPTVGKENSPQVWYKVQIRNIFKKKIHFLQ